jgi:opacity protein-like surface antigen
MATHAIGKLKFNLSKQGLAYRWGDGEIHRLFAGKSEQVDVENEENYTGYEGDEYVEDGYADPGYDDEYEDIRANMSLLGLGVTHYFEYNIFITASCGISQFHVNDDIAVFSAIVQSNTSPDINTGFGFQVGGGKEWWVSDNWGIGASAALLYGFASNLADAKESSLGITLRFSATYN